MNMSIVIDPKDNVATALLNLDEGGVIKIKIGQCEKKIELRQPIPFGHKFALRTIKKGEHVIKYGDVIGKATQTIKEGEHVHIHNVESLRGRRDSK